MEDTKYCICCGEDVPYNRIERDGKIELTCSYCGFPLPDDEKTVVAMEDTSVEATSTEGTSTVSEPVQAVPERMDKFDYVLFADDSKFTRKMIKDSLIEKDLANEILEFENGLELTAGFAKLASEKKVLDAVMIIDINMPVMDGIAAAKFLRNIESQKGIPHLPMAFFSSVKADENFKNLLIELAPAHYVNKASDPDPDKLLERLEQLLSYFMQMR
jgi:CheY-like chemotaxis protein